MCNLLLDVDVNWGEFSFQHPCLYAHCHHSAIVACLVCSWIWIESRIRLNLLSVSSFPPFHCCRMLFSLILSRLCLLLSLLLYESSVLTCNFKTSELRWKFTQIFWFVGSLPKFGYCRMLVFSLLCLIWISVCFLVILLVLTCNYKTSQLRWKFSRTFWLLPHLWLFFRFILIFCLPLCYCFKLSAMQL